KTGSVATPDINPNAATNAATIVSWRPCILRRLRILSIRPRRRSAVLRLDQHPESPHVQLHAVAPDRHLPARPDTGVWRLQHDRSVDRVRDVIAVHLQAVGVPPEVGRTILLGQESIERPESGGGTGVATPLDATGVKAALTSPDDDSEIRRTGRF